VKLRTLLLACGASLALAGLASAQSPVPPTPPGSGYRALPPFRIATIVRASGFAPLFRPMRQGDTYVLRALDRNDVEYRLVLDAYTGRTMSVHATGARGAPGYGPYGRPVYGRIFGPRDERFDSGYGYGPPRPPRIVTHVPPPRPNTQPSAPPSTQPSTQAGTPPAAPTQLAAPAPGSTTTQAPLPRPRPYVMEATSSIPADAPKSAEPQKAPPPPAPTPPVHTPPNNGGASMPPVTPLD